MRAPVRRPHTTSTRLLLLSLLAAGSVASADPPGTVARMSDAIGDIGYSRVDDERWTSLERNRPLVDGDRLWTGPRSRLELQVGSAAIRLASDTSLEILALDDRLVQLRVTQGTLNLRVPRLYEGQQFEIATPTLALVVDRPGRFRVDVAPNEVRTTVTVRAGAATAYDARSRLDLRAGDHIVFRGRTLDGHRTAALPAADVFDRYCSDRDRRLDDSASLRYVGDDVIGHADLDDYGSWQSVDDYGAVWFPRGVRSGWAPFRDGHWAWQAPWGWTWIDDAPWGFAPSHYGRWLQVAGRWGWLPGPRDARPYYAPALVAFIGGGGARIGWFPLGPRELYLPPYRVGRDYFERVNRHGRGVDRASIDASYRHYSRADARTETVSYRNRRVAGAVSAMDGIDFAGAQPVRGGAMTLGRDALERGAITRGAPLEPPSRGDAPARPEARTRPARGVFDREVVTRNDPTRGNTVDRRTMTDPQRTDLPGDRPRGSDTPRSALESRDRTPVERSDGRGTSRSPAADSPAPIDRGPRQSPLQAVPQEGRTRIADPENTETDGRRARSRLLQPVPASDLPERTPSRRGPEAASPTVDAPTAEEIAADPRRAPAAAARGAPSAASPPAQHIPRGNSPTRNDVPDRERDRNDAPRRLRPQAAEADPDAAAAEDPAPEESKNPNDE
jgi:hypothetical protein